MSAFKRLCVGLVLTTMLLPALWAAGAKDAAQPTGPVDIVYWRSLTGVAGDAQDELVERFNASQDLITAEAQFQGAYADLVQKLLAGLAARAVPDVVLLDSPFVGLFAKDGVLVPLDTFAAADRTGFSFENYIAGLRQDGYYDGKPYAVPFMRSTPLLYYNADMFREAGLPVRAPDTWEEFAEFSRRLTKVAGGETTQFGSVFTMGRTTAHWYFQGAVYGYGGQISDDDFNIHLETPAVYSAAQLWQDMVLKDKSAIASTDPHGEFLNNRVAIAFGSTGSMANLFGRATFDVRAGFMPGQVQRLVPVGGAVLAMTSTDRARQNGTWEFMKYMTNPDSISFIVRTTGYMPISRASLEHPETVAYYNQYPERRVAVDQLAYTRPQASVISLGMGTEILRQMVEKMLIGGVPVQQVMRETTIDLRKEIEESF